MAERDTYVIATSNDGYRQETSPYRIAHERDEAWYWIGHAAAKAYDGMVWVWKFNSSGGLEWTKSLNSVSVMRKRIQESALWEEGEDE